MSRFQMRRNCERLTPEGIPQNERTRLQHPWYISDFYIYAPNEYTILTPTPTPQLLKLLK
jgi:hypothetical protein